MPSKVELNRLRWRCRLGLLENDLVLERFLETQGPGLQGERLRAFEALLDFGDNELWSLMSGQSECSDPALREVVQLLRRC